MLDKLKHRNSTTTTKMVLIGILIALLMIPTTIINSLIYERESRQDEAIYEVSQKWGSVQILEGPIVTVPYLWSADLDRNNSDHYNYVHLLPEALSIEGEVSPEIRSRGIFQVPLYSADLKVTGTFLREASLFPVPQEQILWDKAQISLGVSDIRGLGEQVRMNVDGTEATLESGGAVKDLFPSGVGLDVPTFGTKNTHTFVFDVVLNGTEMLHFTPLGKETKVSLSSPWINPSFDGAFLPTEHDITDAGFTASWSVLDVNRNYPQVWVGETFSTIESQFGVKLFMPVDHYQQTTRSVKYAILFITLTFLGFFLVEILNRFSVHPIQYLLVGFAIVLFYLLLLSLSEQIGFSWAYLSASAGIVLMVSLYSASVLRNKKFGFLIGLLLILLYVFLYFLLQMEDFALVLGSLGLFLILGAVMYLTRNIDWYAMKNGE